MRNSIDFDLTKFKRILHYIRNVSNFQQILQFQPTFTCVSFGREKISFGMCNAADSIHSSNYNVDTGMWNEWRRLDGNGNVSVCETYISSTVLRKIRLIRDTFQRYGSVRYKRNSHSVIIIIQIVQSKIKIIST